MSKSFIILLKCTHSSQSDGNSIDLRPCIFSSFCLLFLQFDVCHSELNVHKKASEYDQEIPQSHTADQPTAPRGRATEKNNIHKTSERKQSKASSSLYPMKIIAKLEKTQSSAHRNMEKTQGPTIGATFTNESTPTEPLP